MRLLTTFALMLFVSVTLAGCVGSETPFFSEADGITDSSLTGTYIVTNTSDNKKAEIKVFLNGNKYIAATKEKAKEKLYFIGRLYAYHDPYFIAQIRMPENINYFYFILRKAPSGATLDLISCTTDLSPTCQLKDLRDKNELTQAVNAAIEHFPGKQTMTAEKKNDLEP